MQVVDLERYFLISYLDSSQARFRSVNGTTSGRRVRGAKRQAKQSELDIMVAAPM
jgi:hypothetical protein